MHHFYAMLSRMKYINRWGLMRNSRYENLCEHSFEVAALAHCLALLRNRRFGGDVDVGHVLSAALYHDVSEIMHGDLPTPVKYHNQKLTRAYKEIERMSERRMLELLPQDLREEIGRDILAEDPEIRELVKAADKLSGLIKCMEEEKTGNHEFASARQSLQAYLRGCGLPEVDVFLTEFLPSYELELDELQPAEEPGTEE